MYSAFECGRLAAGPDGDPLIGPKQNHALFPRVTHHGFSDRRSRPFRINVFITPAVHGCTTPAVQEDPDYHRTVAARSCIDGAPAGTGSAQPARRSLSARSTG